MGTENCWYKLQLVQNILLSVNKLASNENIALNKREKFTRAFNPSYSYIIPKTSLNCLDCVIINSTYHFKSQLLLGSYLSDN